MPSDFFYLYVCVGGGEVRENEMVMTLIKINEDHC